MRYPSGKQIKVGDRVSVYGMIGVVVCHFDNREFLEGFSRWDIPDIEMIRGGKLDSGTMVQTEDVGLLHCPHDDQDIVLADAD